MATVVRVEVAKVVAAKVVVAKVVVAKVVVAKVAVAKVEVAKEKVEKGDPGKVAPTVRNGRKMKIGKHLMNVKMTLKEKVVVAKVEVEKVVVEKVKLVKEDLEKVAVAKVEVVKVEVVNVKGKVVQEKENAKAKEASLLLKDARKNVNLAVLEVNVPGVAEDLFVMRNCLLYNHQVV